MLTFVFLNRVVQYKMQIEGYTQYHPSVESKTAFLHKIICEGYFGLVPRLIEKGADPTANEFCAIRTLIQKKHIPLAVQIFNHLSDAHQQSCLAQLTHPKNQRYAILYVEFFHMLSLPQKADAVYAVWKNNISYFAIFRFFTRQDCFVFAVYKEDLQWLAELIDSGFRIGVKTSLEEMGILFYLKTIAEQKGWTAIKECIETRIGSRYESFDEIEGKPTLLENPYQSLFEAPQLSTLRYS